MSVLTRRERVFQERERSILGVAREMLLTGGIAGLSMEGIAEAIDYSRATVYQHFACKEDIVLALTIESTKLRMRLSERAVQFKAKPRERMFALGEVNCLLCPRHIYSEYLTYTSAVRSKTSPERQQYLERLELRFIGVNEGLVMDGFASGDLEPPNGLTPKEVMFSLWAYANGVFGSINTATPLSSLGIDDLNGAFRRGGAALLDAMGWRPFTTEWDYRQTMRRIYTEVFPESLIKEIRKAP